MFGRREVRFSELTSDDYLADPAHCPLHPSHPRLLLQDDDEPSAQPTQFLAHAGVWVVASLAAALFLGLLFLLLLQTKPVLLVGLAVIVQVRAAGT